MTRTILTLISAWSVTGCAKDSSTDPIHVTCDNLNERNITSRIDNLVSEQQAIIALNGQCLEASYNQQSGSAWFARFESKPETDDPPGYHIEVYFKPITSPTQLEAYIPPAGFVEEAQCSRVVDAEKPSFCAHIDLNEGNSSAEIVDYRVKTGWVDFETIDSSDGRTLLKGPFEWTFATLDKSEWPVKIGAPAVTISGNIQLSIND